jgi:Flp pilus assembly pilin Flp
MNGIEYAVLVFAVSLLSIAIIADDRKKNNR